MKKQRAFLKWAGGKYSLVEDIQRHLPEARELVEPFVGAGSVFLNTDFERYLLADINPDLINFYNLLKPNLKLTFTKLSVGLCPKITAKKSTSIFVSSLTRVTMRCFARWRFCI